jgi:hypothetical protein
MRKTLLAFVFVGLSACAPKPIQDSIFEKVSWETKAQIRHLRDNQVHNISIDVYAVKGDKLRMEASGTLGYKLASVVMDREKVQAIVFTEKKFYFGSASQDVMTKAFRVPVPPNVFFAIIFDQQLRGTGWKCESDPQGLIQSCLNKDLIRIEWERLESPSKIVRLKTKTFEMEWYFKALDLEWQPKNEIFNLTAPQNYQSVKL